jgi:predicted GIY-YIG superfamily endonuclease
LYRYFSAAGDLLYIGISLSPVVRLGQHEKHSGWFDSIATVKIEHFDTRKQALAAEREAIRKEDPQYNKRHKIRHEPSRFEVEETESGMEKSKQRLFRRLVSVKPFYTMQETASVLKISTIAAKSLIEDGKLGAVITRRFTRNHKGTEKAMVVYGVTGWHLIDYLEYLETAEKKQ